MRDVHHHGVKLFLPNVFALLHAAADYPRSMHSVDRSRERGFSWARRIIVMVIRSTCKLIHERVGVNQ